MIPFNSITLFILTRANHGDVSLGCLRSIDFEFMLMIVFHMDNMFPRPNIEYIGKPEHLDKNIKNK